MNYSETCLATLICLLLLEEDSVSWWVFCASGFFWVLVFPSWDSPSRYWNKDTTVLQGHGLSLQHCRRTREPLIMGELKIEAKQGMWWGTRTWISKGSLCHDRKSSFFFVHCCPGQRNETWGSISTPLHLERSWAGEGEDTPRRVCERVTRADTSICPKILVEDTELR